MMIPFLESFREQTCNFERVDGGTRVKLHVLDVEFNLDLRLRTHVLCPFP